LSKQALCNKDFHGRKVQLENAQLEYSVCDVNCYGCWLLANLNRYCEYSKLGYEVLAVAFSAW